MSSATRRFRVIDGEVREVGAQAVEAAPILQPLVSDAMGFPQQQFDEFEVDRQRHGFSDVEFRRDPEVPEFFQVLCATPAARDRYAKHRGMVNRTGIGGLRLTQADLDRAGGMVERKYAAR